ncbi:MAG: ABC transporter ATP-binding protein/permease [Clostridia bacterium]|nr:ABC transporter ATP-binding protein/permease [Clostridia bacterium]
MTVSKLVNAAALFDKEGATLGDFFEALGMQGVFSSMPQEYADALYSTSLKGGVTGVDVAAIVDILIKTVILVCASGLLSYAQGFILSTVAQNISYRFRRDIYAKIDKLPLKYFDGTTHGEVLSYLTNDVDTISTSMNQSFAQLVTAITTLVGVMVMMFRINWIMTLVAILIVPISIGLVMLIVSKSQKYYLRQQEYLGHVNGQIEEVFGGQSVIKLFNGEERTRREFGAQNDKLYESAWKSQFYSGLMMPINKFVGNLSFVITCVLGGYMVIGGKLMVGQVQAFATYVKQFNQPIAQVSGIANTLQSTIAASERVFNFLEEEEEKETGELSLGQVNGDVSFKDVRFGYNADNIIIKGFNCDVKAGQRIAIVGPTGAGKTTIVKLLMRFYELNGGTINIDGKDATSFTRKSLREEVGMVLQDTWLFNGTIRDNIGYGKLGASEDEIVAAAKCAYADHFINTLPNGYDFVINEEAANISQGQKQLLTIARAILADPKILILDEATSSVDTRTEALIQQAMDTLMQGRTSFIIAHRLSTIRNADLILVMRDGDIVEQGNHEQLLAQHGFYAQLYNSQFDAA